MRTTGTYVTTTTLGEAVQAFVPHALPPADPPLAAESYTATNHRAEMALARLAGVAGLVPSVDWLLYSAIRKEALLTSQIEGTQATLTDLFDNEAGQVLANTADVEEVTNYLRAFRLVRDNLRSEDGLPISVRLLCDAHRLLLDGARPAAQLTWENVPRQNLHDAFMLHDQLDYLPNDILCKVDRASMANSLEVREPLLDHPWMEWISGLPPEFKLELIAERRFGSKLARISRVTAIHLPADYRPSTPPAPASARRSPRPG